MTQETRRQWWKPTAEKEYGLAIVWNNDYKGGMGFGIRTEHGQGEIISLNFEDTLALRDMVQAHINQILCTAD